MRIRKIKIKNFRNLRDIEIYPASTTIIVGENNTGKSNLIYGLRLMLDPNAKRFEISEDDINDKARSEGEDYFSIMIEIGDLQHHQELEAIFRDRLAKDNDETFIKIEGRYQKDEENNYFWSVFLLPPEERHNDPILFTNRMFRSIPLYFLDAIRDAEIELRATRRGALSQFINEIEIDDVEDEIIENIRRANEALGKNQGILQLTQNITGLLAPYIPGGKGIVSMSVATEDPTQIMKGLRINLKSHPSLKAHDISRHGTGLQNLILIAMFKHKISTSQGIQPILAIEEPEAHLHPQVQRCVVEDLVKIEGPVFLTTHSPSIVECADPLSIIRLVPDEKNQITAYQLDPLKIDINDRIQLKRFLRSGRSDAFFARAILIVEGPSEVITLPSFASLIGIDLNREGISVIPANGNAFSFILKTCDKTQFSIPYVVLFDTDALESSNDLVNEAYKAGLIDSGTRNSGSSGTQSVRQKILEDIGWVPVIKNFEEQLIQSGYLKIILDVIDDFESMGSLDGFLNKNKFKKDHIGVAAFLNQNRRGKGLKIPVAQKIATETENIKKVPDCFKNALKLVVKLSQGNTS